MLLLLLVLWGKSHMHVYFLCVYMINAICSSLSLFVLRWSRGHVITPSGASGDAVWLFAIFFTVQFCMFEYSPENGQDNCGVHISYSCGCLGYW